MKPAVRAKCLRLACWMALCCLCLPMLLPCGAAQAAELTLSSGNYGWFVPGETTKALTFFYKNCPGSEVPSFSIYDQDGITIAATPTTDYVATYRYIQLKVDFLKKLPLKSYTIDISCSTGAISATFYILKQQTIIFVEQPQTVTIDAKENASFSVRVTGTTGFSYQWQRRSRTGWKNLSAKSRTMTLRSVPAYMCGYHYRVLVHSAIGDAYSDTARVFIRNVPATGDTQSPVGYALAAGLSLAGMAGCLLWGRRRRRLSLKK